MEPQTVAHAEEMFAILSDPAIYEFENEPPSSIDWLHGRFARLETRQSPDGKEQWLNWVIRHPASGLIGFVQATIHQNGCADIAYVLSSTYWGHGHAAEAVQAMIEELVARYQVRTFFAVFKRRNVRSLRLLRRLEFVPELPGNRHECELEQDELRMQLQR